MTRRVCEIVLVVIYICTNGLSLCGQTLSGPAESEPGALFVIDVSVPAGNGPAQRLSFDPVAVQFMGLVAPTPEVQLTGDSVLEIAPDKGKGGTYQVKFLPFPTASSAEFSFAGPAAGGSNLHVTFVAKVEEKQYHLHILVGGIFLLIVAWVVWRYQKKNPGLMSTRSLFLNFEELQKAREQFFADHPSQAGPAVPAQVAEPCPGEGISPAAPRQADSTQAMPAISGTPGTAVPSSTDGQSGQTLEMTIPLPKPEQEAAPAAPIGQGETSASRDAVPAVQPPLEIQEPLSAGEPVTAELPVVTPTKEEPDGIGDTSKKTVVRSGVSGKVPAVDSTMEMPSAAQPFEKAGSSDKTISRSGFLRQSGTAAIPSPIVVKLIDEAGKVFEGRGMEVLIGRAKECNISMTAAEVSRRHLLVKRDQDRFVAVSQTASNVTEINGTPVKTASEIHSGDKISLGGTVFTIEITS